MGLNMLQNILFTIQDDGISGYSTLVFNLKFHLAL